MYRYGIFEIIYSGTEVKYYKNSILLNYTSTNVSTNKVFYLNIGLRNIDYFNDPYFEILEFSDIIPDFNVDSVNHTIIDNPFLTESLLETKLAIFTNCSFDR